MQCFYNGLPNCRLDYPPKANEFASGSMKNSGVTTNMGWERWEEWKCIFAEQWEEVYWEFVRFLSLMWSQPVYAAYIVFFAPGLFRMVLFFCPLVISTCLLVLVIFSFGPQLDRVRVERDLQWEGFKEAVVGSMGERDGDGDGYTRFRVLRRVKRPGRCSTDWLNCLNDDACQSILYAEGQLHGDTEEERLKEEFENLEGGIPMADVKSLGSSHSVIVSRIAVLLERLIADLGGRVEVDVLYALEAISQIFIETTLRECETEVIKASSSGFEVAQNQQSDEHIGECSVGGKSVSVNAHNVDRCEQGIEPTECMPHRGGMDASKALNGELDRTICDEGTVDGNVIAESSIVISYPQKLSEISQVLDQDEGSLSSVERGVDAPEDPDRDVPPALDKCVFKSCRSFPVDSSEEGLLAMDKLWEAENSFDRLEVEKTPSVSKGKDWKRTLACKLYEEKQNSWKETLAGKLYEDQTKGSTRFRGQLSSSLGRIPQHQNYTDFFVGRFTNGSSESRVLAPAESPMIAEEMDLLWEAYNDASNHAPGSPIKGLAKGLARLKSIRGNADSDAEDGPESPQLCCLRAFRFSTGKLSLRKPNLVKISKAFKNFGLIQHIRGPKQNTT